MARWLRTHEMPRKVRHVKRRLGVNACDLPPKEKYYFDMSYKRAMKHPDIKEAHECMRKSIESGKIGIYEGVVLHEHRKIIKNQTMQ